MRDGGARGGQGARGAATSERGHRGASSMADQLITPPGNRLFYHGSSDINFKSTWAVWSQGIDLSRWGPPRKPFGAFNVLFPLMSSIRVATVEDMRRELFLCASV